ncbi:MAG: hypothetical protein ACNA8W_14535, partial [Bradymonadaceae bacterium]
VLLAGDRRLEILRARQGSLSWENTVDTGLTTTDDTLTHFWRPGLYRTDQGLILVFNQALTAHIFRANE